MDEFDQLQSDLAGSLITMEFGEGGRINQLWASDPALPEEGEDFQFVLPPIQFGEEASDDYNPGTILIGIRTSPDEPWMVSRNRGVKPVNEDFDSYDPSTVEFQYEFPLLDSITVHGKFFELPGQLPQIVWQITIKNEGRRTVEIGELGFPMAFNNFYDGFGWNDDQLKRLWHSRCYIHKFIGGAASWLFAQRMTAETPGLLVFPGDNTSWEFYTHVRSSLITPYQWEGIPIVYIHSKATIEREEWPTWFNEHTSLILEPGDQHVVELRFVPIESDKVDGINQALSICGRPTIKVLPSAVAPTDVGIAVEVGGCSPSRFYVSREAVTEVDTDENGGFCFVKPKEPGPLIVSFQDRFGKMCHAHLMFTDPIGELIQRRARWITENQIVHNKDSLLNQSPVLTNIVENKQILDKDEYLISSGLECAIGEALFLAEKNANYPDRKQIKILETFIDEFLLDDIQNPGTLAVSSLISEQGAGFFGRPMSYPSVANFYHSMARIAEHIPESKRSAVEYLQLAEGTIDAMFRFGWRLYVRTVGVLGFARIYELLEDLERHGLANEAMRLQNNIDFKATELTQLKYPYAGETVMDTSGFEEVFSAARYLDDDDHIERTARAAFATRSLAASWWWYGSDKRHWDGGDSSPLKALLDHGEACLSHTTIPNSLIFFGLMDRDYLALPEAYVRMAFGGMIGPWALVRNDGAASMCYCPDLASAQAGYNAYTGASGLGYYHYLRGTGAYYLPNRDSGDFNFGCHYNLDEDSHVIRPWDGVGRRIILRQIGARFELSFGQFRELRLDTRLRKATVQIWNPFEEPVTARLSVEGLWGRTYNVGGTTVTPVDGVATVEVTLPPQELSTIGMEALPD